VTFVPPRKDARAQLKKRVDGWAKKLRVSPRRVRIQKMTRKWGSCSLAGTVTLAADLHLQDEGFQDFVVAHELLHLRIANHGRLFKAVMSAHLPRWRSYEDVRRARPRASNVK
jgi:predicted metal-dependent hydrolase